jgi:Putative lumazine-binding
MTPKPNPQRGALQSKENAMKRRDFLKAAGVGAAASVATSKAVAQSQLPSRDQFDIDSHDKIWQVVDLAMKGAAEGDLAKLGEAFHRDARMFGEVYGKRYDAPIAEFFDLCEKHPLGKGGRYRQRIISITRVGGAAMAMVAEDGCWGSASFVDFFTVTQIDGAWKITNKTFAYTGGEIPPEVLGQDDPKASRER